MSKETAVWSKRTNRKRIMVFDVETTGLIPKKRRMLERISSDSKEKVKNVVVSPTLEECPYILQLSFVIYETAGWKVVKKYDAYVKVADTIVIEPVITDITGITREICDREGLPIGEVLTEFYKEYMLCDCIVAHNISFDREMIAIELLRNGHSIEKQCPFWRCVFNDMYHVLHNIETYCTMNVGRSICKLPRPTGTRGYKSPTLTELYQYLFARPPPPNLHNSLVDTFVCLQCFVKLRFRFQMRTTVESQLMVATVC